MVEQATTTRRTQTVGTADRLETDTATGWPPDTSVIWSRTDDPPPATGWTHAVPLLTNGFVVRDLLYAVAGFVIAAMLATALTGWLIEGVFWSLSTRTLVALAAGATTASVLIAWLVFQNRVPTTYTLTPEGVHVAPAPRHPADGPRARLAGRLARRLATLHPFARDLGVVAWWEVQRVSVYPETGTIVLGNRWFTLLRLYCPPARLPELARQVHDLVDRDVARRPPRPEPRFYAPHAAWTALALLAALAARAWSPAALDTHEPALLIAALVIAGGLRPTRSVRRLGFLAMLWSAFLVALVLGVALDTNTVVPGFPVTDAYQIDTPALVLTLVGLTTLMVMGFVSTIGRAPAHRRPQPRPHLAPVTAVAPVHFTDQDLALDDAAG